MVTSIAFGGMGVFSSKEIRCGESLMYEGVLGTNGLSMWSMNAETRSVGPLQLLTMGLIPWGLLWRKYIRCVLTFSVG